MDLKDVLRFCLQYTADHVIASLDAAQVAPAPWETRQLLLGIGRLLRSLDPEEEVEGYAGETGH